MATQTPNNEMISSRKRSRLSETFSPIANRGLSAKPIETTTSKYLKHNNNEKISINSNNIHKIDDLNVNPIDVNRIGLVDVTKIFNDHVHGNIKLDGLCLHIIDTPEFQRLHNLKQNGSTDFVYRGATHTRFEHSIGVAHLAERFVKTLHANQPNLNITATDILCVKVAGLCHDLGHGPFSHVFDGVFLKRMYPHGIDCNSKKWRHEDGSIMMFRHLLAKNGIHLPTYGLTNFCDVENQPTLETKNSLNTLKRSLSATSALRVSNHSMIDSLENSNIHIQYDDQLFIEEIIGGVPEAKRKGRNPSKFFLYDIVNNIRSGLDVDKLDYFQRDMKMANIFPMPVVTFDRFVELAIVLPAEPIESKPTPVNNTNVSSNDMLSQKNHHPSFYDKQHSVADSGSETEEDEDTQQEMNEPFNISKYPLMICYPEKMISEALNLFAARFHMHKEVYTHKATKQVEFMIVDALELANPYINIKGSVSDLHPDGFYKMSEVIFDMTAMSNLKDSILDIIMYDSNPKLKPAQHIINRIQCRDLYCCIGETSYKNIPSNFISNASDESIAREIVRYANEYVGTMSRKIDDTHDHSSYSVLLAATPGQSPDTSMSHDTPSSTSNSIDNKINNTVVSLTVDDLIIERMHIHHGLKSQNPVDRLRFYPKTVYVSSSNDAANVDKMKQNVEPIIGRKINEEKYSELLPRCFEKHALRVFCRSSSYSQVSLIARKGYELFCQSHALSIPFPSASQ